MDLQHQKLNQIIYSRFSDFLVSSHVAKHKLGLTQTFQSSDSERGLLDIEAKAQLNKERNARSANEFLIYINEYFHDVLSSHIEQLVNNGTYIFTDIFKIDTPIRRLINLCMIPDSSANQLADVINGVPWLKKDLLALVNQPPFRDPESTRPLLDDVNLAIRYVGPDNIKMPILALTVKHWQPHSTDPFPHAKTKIWQYSVAVANCMEQLSSYSKLNSIHCYALGLLQGIGHGLSLRLYLRTFDTVRSAEMQKARRTARPDIEKALSELQFDGDFASQIMCQHAHELSRILIAKLELPSTDLVSAMEQLIQWPALANQTSMGRLLIKSITYSQYKILQKGRLIELHEAKRFLTGAKINNDFISYLNSVDLTKLNLSPKLI